MLWASLLKPVPVHFRYQVKNGKQLGDALKSQPVLDGKRLEHSFQEDGSVARKQGGLNKLYQFLQGIIYGTETQLIRRGMDQRNQDVN